jgi:hypothetical protein
MNRNVKAVEPQLGLLLLVPAAVLLAKRGKASPGDVAVLAWVRRGRRPGVGTVITGASGVGEGTADGYGAFRLPPKIESMLDNWHTRAHQAADRRTPDDLIEHGPEAARGLRHGAGGFPSGAPEPTPGDGLRDGASSTLTGKVPTCLCCRPDCSRPLPIPPGGPSSMMS